MPTLEFNGKHHIYTHHLSVPTDHLKLTKTAPSTRSAKTITSSFTTTTYTPSKHYSHATKTASSASTFTNALSRFGIC